MKRSSERILTTHCGSLPRPTALVALLAARDMDQPYDHAALDSGIQQSVNQVVRAQADLGIDVINDGEHSKTSFSSYAAARLGGLTPIDAPFGFQGPTRDTLQFAGAYAEMKVMYAARPSNATRAGGTGGVRRAYACTGVSTGETACMRTRRDWSRGWSLGPRKVSSRCSVPRHRTMAALAARMADAKA